MSADRTAICGELRCYLADNFLMGAVAPALSDGDSFLEHQVLDSTGFLELICYLEERYGIKVHDDELLPENLDSVERVAEFVTRKLAP